MTIPKNSGLKDGDIVNIEKQKIKNIVYSFTTGDMFHYGQLRLLEEANKYGEFHICGILSDEAIKSYRNPAVASFKDRSAVVSALRCVDMVMIQNKQDPTENLKEIHDKFRNSKIILVHGSNWEKIPGSDYVESIGGEVVKMPYYDKLSDEKVLNKIKNFVH